MSMIKQPVPNNIHTSIATYLDGPYHHEFADWYVQYTMY